MKRLLIALLVLALLPVCSFADEWVCPVCGRTNNDNFCTEDATPRPEEQICSVCGTVNDVDANFCTNCANPLSSSVSVFTYSVGDIVTFGSYEQDGDESNGTEPIEWRVLEDKGDGTYVLLSEYGLEAKAYNEEYEDMTWESCTLRSWLNGEFYATAFTDEEQAQIQLTDLENADNAEYGTEGGHDTQDYVYLLSLEEIKKYFGVEAFDRSEELICMPTQHAVDSGTWILSANDVKKLQQYYSYELREGTCFWLLRSPGRYADYAANVDCNGFVDSTGSDVSRVDDCVRPVVVVRL